MRIDRSNRITSRRGVALLEVLAALTILAVAGTSMIALGAENVRALSRARDTEAEMRRANALMEAVALWTRDDLDRRLGDRPQGHWRLRIVRPVETLYEITLLDSAGTRVLLSTALFRRPVPEVNADARP